MVCRYDDSFKPAEDDGMPWLEGLFEGAQDALQRAEDRVSVYMAAKVLIDSNYQQPNFALAFSVLLSCQHIHMVASITEGFSAGVFTGGV